MQVPDSLYGKTSVQETGRKKDGDRVPPADDSFRKVMAHDRRQIKQTDADAKRKSKNEIDTNDDVSEVDEEEEEFSIFSHPKRPVKAPQLTNRQVNEDISETELEEPEEEVSFLPKEDPSNKEVKKPILRQDRLATPQEDQEKLDQVRQDGSNVFVDKKDKKEEVPQQRSTGKTTKNQQTQSLTKPQENDEPQTPTKDVIKGKVAIREQETEPQKDIASPGSSQKTGKFQQVMEKQAPEMRNLTGASDIKPDTPKRAESPKNQVPNKSGQGEPQPTKEVKDEIPIDPRTVAIVIENAMPKENNDIIPVDQPIQKPPLAQKLQEIVDQIVKEIYTLSDNGNSETTIILHHPPLFDGATVKIETFKTAPNQLNITFSNLTGPGKRILDENIASLKTALEQNERGYIVQQLNTTTLKDVPHYVADAQQPQKERDQENPQQQKRQREQEEQDTGPNKRKS